MRAVRKFSAIAILITCCFASAHAGDLKILANPPIRDSLAELTKIFEARSGQKLETRVSVGLDLLKLGAEWPFDVAFVLRPLLKEPQSASLFRPDSIVAIANTGLGVTVRRGAAKPDVSTPDALKQALLKARNFGFVPASTVGDQVFRMMAEIGIADAMKQKLVNRDIVDEVVRDIAKGEIEITIIPLNIIAAAPGVDLVAAVPPPVQQKVEVVTALPLKESANEQAARDLIALFKSEAGAAVMKSKGLTPE